MKIFPLACWLVCLAIDPCSGGTLRVDFGRTNGLIRPLHGVNSGPLNYGGLVDLSGYHRELRIPFTRLHDCHWPNPDVVDIHVIFPNFDADPTRPESYQFERTDDYIRAILDVGSQVVFRLGESIEHTKKKYHAHPPRDFGKWAEICLGIIRHYNEGWAGGHRWNIRHWEIWNEPDNRPACWTGTDEEYFRLYTLAAKAIKRQFPNLLIGGPALGNTGKLTGERLEPTPFLAGFLGHVRRENAPLDFFSWHWYDADPAVFHRRAAGVRKLLDEHGFTQTESHLNEWNYLPGNDWRPVVLAGQGAPREKFYEETGGAPGAAFSACVLIDLQRSPVDMANYFTGEIQGPGLFTFHGSPKKTFHAFKAFRALLDTPMRVAASGDDPGRLSVCAGLNPAKTQAAILVSHFQSTATEVELLLENLPWHGETRFEIFLVDAESDLQRVNSGKWPSGQVRLVQRLPAPAVCLIKLSGN